MSRSWLVTRRVEDYVAGGLRGAEVRDCAVTIAGAVGVEARVSVEDCGGVAEDEVDAAFDEALDVILAAVVGEERVLMAEEADSA